MQPQRFRRWRHQVVGELYGRPLGGVRLEKRGAAFIANIFGTRQDPSSPYFGGAGQVLHGHFLGRYATACFWRWRTNKKMRRFLRNVDNAVPRRFTGGERDQFVSGNVCKVGWGDVFPLNAVLRELEKSRARRLGHYDPPRDGTTSRFAGGYRRRGNFLGL